MEESLNNYFTCFFFLYYITELNYEFIIFVISFRIYEAGKREAIRKILLNFC